MTRSDRRQRVQLIQLAEMLGHGRVPNCKYHAAELRAPVANMVLANDVVARKATIPG